LKNSYVYLKFPAYKDMLQYIKEVCNIHEIGLIQRRQYFNKGNSVTYFLRLTKRLFGNELILICDTEIFTGFINEKPIEEINALRKTLLAEIEKALKEILPNHKSIEAEYQLEP